MKLRNKKTGEIIDIKDVFRDSDDYPNHYIISNKWKEIEESKRTWFIDTWGSIREREAMEIPIGWKEKPILEFETKEEAEKAVEKLKAWKRLKDKGFKVDLWDYDGGNYQERIKTGRILFRVKDYEENDKDLDLLFGGEE